MTFAIHSSDGKGFGAGMADYPPPFKQDCECEACFEDVEAPPVDWISPTEWAFEQAAEACGQDMADAPRDLLDRWDYL